MVTYLPAFRWFLYGFHGSENIHIPFVPWIPWAKCTFTPLSTTPPVALPGALHLVPGCGIPGPRCQWGLWRFIYRGPFIKIWTDYLFHWESGVGIPPKLYSIVTNATLSLSLKQTDYPLRLVVGRLSFFKYCINHGSMQVSTSFWIG